jgi:hypothetical protein
MKKLFLIPIFTLLLSSVDAQKEAEIYRSLGKYFKKTKVSKLDGYLLECGGIKTPQKTLPNMFNGTPSFNYDAWEFYDYAERYYVFRSYNDKDLSASQIQYVENNMIDKNKEFYIIRNKNYQAYLQNNNGYEVLMVVLNH